VPARRPIKIDRTHLSFTVRLMEEHIAAHFDEAENPNLEVEYFPRRRGAEETWLLACAIKKHDPRFKVIDNVDFFLRDEELKRGYLHDVRLFGPPVDHAGGHLVKLRVIKPGMPECTIEFPHAFLRQSELPMPMEFVTTVSMNVVARLFRSLKRQ
jgi:hypothetical protein